MCMITYLPANVAVPYEEILEGATFNDDGHGWAVAAELGVMLSGHYMDVETALETFRLTRQAFPDVPAMFHSRFATHGSVSLSNVHPFDVGKFAAVAHNGILPAKFQPAKNDIRSDTAILAMEWLAGRTQVSGVWTRRERQRIGRIIGQGNKLCILSVSPFLDKPKGYLVNGAMGNWHKGAWFSNRDWQPSRYSRHYWPDDYKVGSSSSSAYSHGGNWWNDDDLTLTAHRSLTARKLEICPVCKSTDGLDVASNSCYDCDTCLKCWSAIRSCTCNIIRYVCLTCSEADTVCTCARPEFAEVSPSGDVIAWPGSD